MSENHNPYLTSQTPLYSALGPFHDLVDFIRDQGIATPPRGGTPAMKTVRRALAFSPPSEVAIDVRSERTWERDGVAGEELTWSVGYGPRTQAWLLRPADVEGPLPGIVALHDHGNYKFYGKEKIAAGPEGTPRVLDKMCTRFYEGRAYANELARAGFVVLAHDAFQWSSRKFPFESMPDISRDLKTEAIRGWRTWYSVTEEIARYNCNASFHQPVVMGYCRALGATYEGIVAYEDRVAANYLMGRPDVIKDAVGCVGLSGGGTRSGMLMATHPRIRAAVVVGLMSAFGEAHHYDSAHELRTIGDWPEVVATHAPTPLLVQFCEQDSMFTVAGMKEAHRRLGALYNAAGARRQYTGQFYPERHGFTIAMQDAAIKWFKRVLT